MQKIAFSLALLLMLNSPLLVAEDLLALYSQAIQFDPNVKSAQLQIEMGEAQQGQAGGALLPQISANANISANNQTSNSISNTFNGERYSISLTQSVIDFPKLINWQRYQNIVQQYESSSEEVQQTLMYTVVERYFTALEANDTLLLIEQEISSTKKQLDQMRGRFEKQMAMITDVYELEAKLDVLLADKIAAQTKIDSAQQGLIELTGQSFNKLVKLRNDIAFLALSGAIDEWVAQAENQNPGLAAQDKAVEAADYGVWQQQSKHLPTVDMQLNYFNTNTGYQNNQTPTSETQVAAVNITIPLFSGGTTSRAADEASKSLEINKQKRIGLLRALIKDTRDSFLSTNASVKRIDAAEKALATSTKAREAIQKSFQYGMQTITQVLLSEDREFKAKQDILQAKYAYIKSRARFERVTGVINESFLQSINRWLKDEQLASATVN
ncbi:MAG: TolC family outer membrane protein [Methylococcales bacterium]|nr:TolC family outer membrane protein [Methylococcales bacterium]